MARGVKPRGLDRRGRRRTIGPMRALLLILLPGLALAECPPVEPFPPAYDDLLEQVARAPDRATAQRLSGGLWTFWLDAPDARAQALLDSGMAARAVGDFATARDLLGQLVLYCPDYAEGWNQRAFAAFLRADFEAALADLDRALELSPRHIAALSGKALTLIGMGRDAEGQQVLREALRLNPWLSERRLLTLPPEREL